LPRHTYVGHGGEGQAGSAVRTLCIDMEVFSSFSTFIRTTICFVPNVLFLIGT
jgi:hypothetical protein